MYGFGVQYGVNFMMPVSVMKRYIDIIPHRQCAPDCRDGYLHGRGPSDYNGNGLKGSLVGVHLSTVKGRLHLRH